NLAKLLADARRDLDALGQQRRLRAGHVRLEPVQADVERHQELADVVVELARDVAPLLFLDGEHAIRERAQTLQGAPQVGLRALAIADVLRDAEDDDAARLLDQPRLEAHVDDAAIAPAHAEVAFQRGTI